LELAAKKKRKKKIFDMNKLDAALPEIETKKEGAAEGSGAAEDAPPDVSLGCLSFSSFLLLSKSPG
jgi:hypothetical protein